MTGIPVHIGVDTGGTFTDLVCLDDSGRFSLRKVPSTPRDPSAAILSGLAEHLSAQGHEESDVERVVHGTTIATNAIIERTGACIAILATRGFRDILEIGRQTRTGMYDLELEPSAPVFLAPRRMRFEVEERVSADGEIVQALDEASVIDAADVLYAAGARSVAVCLLFSFLNPLHERRVRDILLERYPDLLVSLSSDIDPTMREYERTVVTAFDAYVKPVVDGYLRRLTANLAELGVKAPVRIMQSRGGVSSVAMARRCPVRLVLSGPAGAVAAGCDLGRAVGFENMITVDIGGTSCDIALVHGGEPVIRAEGTIDRYPVRVPMIDVNAIGSGGGSLAWIDAGGVLRVGPQSAGSVPGPTCYDRGGTEPTVTDASLVLGYLNAENFAAGTMRLNEAAARRAVGARIASPLGLTVTEAALGIHRIINAQMAEGIRLVSVKQGFDPRGFALVPMGGAGPLHATMLADELEIGRVLLPRYPGVMAAIGQLSAPVEHEFATSLVRPIQNANLKELKACLEDLDDKCSAAMREERIDADDVSVSHFADVCYIGQSYSLAVPIDLSKAPLQCIRQDFDAAYARVFGHSMTDPAQIVALRSVHRSMLGVSPSQSPFMDSETGLKLGERSICLAGLGEVSVPVLARSAMPIGFSFDGPALIEQEDTTALIGPAWSGKVVATGAIILEKEGADR